jgi:hypothetical protein
MNESEKQAEIIKQKIRDLHVLTAPPPIVQKAIDRNLFRETRAISKAVTDLKVACLKKYFSREVDSRSVLTNAAVGVLQLNVSAFGLVVINELELAELLAESLEFLATNLRRQINERRKMNAAGGN